MISNIVREALTGSGKAGGEEKFIYKNGLKVLASRGEVITMEHVEKIMDEEGI